MRRTILMQSEFFFTTMIATLFVVIICTCSALPTNVHYNSGSTSTNYFNSGSATANVNQQKPASIPNNPNGVQSGQNQPEQNAGGGKIVYSPTVSNFSVASNAVINFGHFNIGKNDESQRTDARTSRSTSDSENGTKKNPVTVSQTIEKKRVSVPRTTKKTITKFLQPPEAYTDYE